MHPDPMPATERQPVIHVTQEQVFVRQSDGTVRAYYAGDDWYVTGADRAEAAKKLVAECERRMQDPEFFKAHFELTQQHLRGDAVTPGFEVNTISTDDYQQRMGELGEQVRTPKHRRAGTPRTYPTPNAQGSQRPASVADQVSADQQAPGSWVAVPRREVC